MSLSIAELLAVAFSVGFALAAAWVVVRPYKRLAGRVRPYATVARVDLTRAVDVGGTAQAGSAFGDATLGRLFQPMFDRVLHTLARLLATSSTALLALRLRQAGLDPDLGDLERVNEFRIRSLLAAAGWSVGLGFFGLVVQGPWLMVSFAILGFAFGVLNARGRIDRGIATQRDRIRGELYTINQLLAMRTRVGGGVVDAIRHVVVRGNGAVIDELAEVLRLHETGVALTAALSRAAELTAEPEAARTYAVLATAQERGADLGDALLDLSKDLRSARRENLQREAARRRLLMVIPIVVVLAPIVLLFIGAPIPQLIFGGT
ncbi:MAG: type II secretion system F family protein [Acidimicrobiia bacterium]|nr:type II secretion system F family protein [Acidimicrobiia bacterium]